MCRLSVVVCVALLLVTAATATNVKQCKKGQPFPLKVIIEGCEEPPCDVYKDSTAVMEVHFVGTKDNIKKLTAIVHATTFGITVPYELPEDVANVCANLMYGASCPIDYSEDVVYKFNFYIEPLYPEISVKVQVSLDDGEGESIACFMVDCKVRKSTGGGRIIEHLAIAEN